MGKQLQERRSRQRHGPFYALQGQGTQVVAVEPETRLCAPCYTGGVNWPALRMCLTCGSVGCCDTSRNKHALKHYEESGHPLIRSIRFDESWVWCYADNAFFEGSILDRSAEQ